MGDVVALPREVACPDGWSFSCAVCRRTDTGWLVVCRFRGLVPHLAALVCTGCGSEHAIESGMLQGRTVQ